MLDGSQSWSGRHGEEKILDPTGTRNSDLSIVQLLASRYTDWAILVPADRAANYVNWCQQIGRRPTAVILADHYSYSIALEQSKLTTWRTHMRRRHIDALFFIQAYLGSIYCPFVLENVGLRAPTRYITAFVYVDGEPNLFYLVTFYSGSSFM
jgi:hypothetical protein